MNPYHAQKIAEARIADWHAQADRDRLIRAGREPRRWTLLRLPRRRRLVLVIEAS